MEMPTGRGISAWPEDPDDLRRTAEVLSQLTRDTYDSDSAVSLQLLITQAGCCYPRLTGRA